MIPCVRRFLLALACSASLASAQSTNPPSGVLLTGYDLSLIGGATLASVALFRIDTRVARAIADSSLHNRYPGLTRAALRGSIPTETLWMLAGGGVYGLARLRGDYTTADIAFHTTEAVASTAMVIQVVRGALGRARPYVIDDVGETRDADPTEFQLFHGFTSFNYRSYPSMHAMASMAVASALSQEMRLRDTPNRGVISPLLYAGALIPSAARMYLDEHWTSDIALGIFLGVFAGQKAVLYSHDHPDNRFDNQFLKPIAHAVVSHDGRGFSFSLTPF